MTWLLLSGGRELARGSWSDVVAAGEELDLVRVDTLGHDTAEPVSVPRIVVRGVTVVPVSDANVH